MKNKRRLLTTTHANVVHCSSDRHSIEVEFMIRSSKFSFQRIHRENYAVRYISTSLIACLQMFSVWQILLVCLSVLPIVGLPDFNCDLIYKTALRSLHRKTNFNHNLNFMLELIVLRDNVHCLPPGFLDFRKPEILPILNHMCTPQCNEVCVYEMIINRQLNKIQTGQDWTRVGSRSL